MRIQFDQDYPVGVVIGVGGTPVPPDLVEVAWQGLRWTGAAVVEAANYGQFYIDDLGRTHIAQHDPAWPLLVCDWDADLVNDGGWRLMTDNDRLADAKTAHLATLKNLCSAAIRAGWVSSALGEPHRYDTATAEDQLNLVTAGQAGLDMPYTCTKISNGVKAQRPHTAAQLAQIYTEVIEEKTRLLGVLDGARQAVDAISITTTLAAAVAEVQAVTADFS